jgi:hypothetical protein
MRTVKLSWKGQIFRHVGVGEKEVVEGVRQGDDLVFQLADGLYEISDAKEWYFCEVCLGELFRASQAEVEEYLRGKQEKKE